MRFKPTPPALRLTRRTSQPGSVFNASMAFVRSSLFMVPSKRSYLMPATSKASSILGMDVVRSRRQKTGNNILIEHSGPLRAEVFEIISRSFSTCRIHTKRLSSRRRYPSGFLVRQLPALPSHSWLNMDSSSKILPSLAAAPGLSWTGENFLWECLSASSRVFVSSSLVSDRPRRLL